MLHFQLDTTALERDLVRALTVLPAGATSISDFSHHVETSIERAWAQSQSAAGLDRAEDDGFARYVSRLAGNDPDAIRHSPLPHPIRMAAAAHLLRQAQMEKCESCPKCMNLALLLLP